MPKQQRGANQVNAQCAHLPACIQPDVSFVADVRLTRCSCVQVFEKSENPDFMKIIEKRYPDKETKFLVGCSDGRKYSLDALGALDEAGYGNLAGLKGGYYAWFRVFDNKLNRRNLGEYQEEMIHDGDSGGIHASGAGFQRVDAADRYVPPSFD